jgi:hypothetical protein
MQIQNALPLHIARAYGLGGPARPAVTPPSPPAPSSPTKSLVGGTVRQPVEFDSGTSASAPNALSLYTRAADRMEVAVAVQVGRSIDVRG